MLVVGGSRETVGAVRLAAEAALRAGAGKLQVATVVSRAETLGVAVPEALVRPLPETADGCPDPAATELVADLASAADAVLVGPGMAGPDESAALVEKLLRSVNGRLVLDALGLAVVGEQRVQGGQNRSVSLSNAVLTPNLEELAICLGVEPAEVEDDAAGAALALATRTGAVVHAGGARSVTAAPDGTVWCDDESVPGLGVSGSGDVAAGAIAGLLARGAEPAQAAVWGARAHAEAGRRLAARSGPVGYLARDIAGELPAALHRLSCTGLSCTG